MVDVKRLRIGFVHPDLGIGGAERLVVDAAVALKQMGHDVVMFTSRHDPARCFEETRDGTLPVHVLASRIPQRLHPKVPMTIVFSILRSIALSFLVFFSQVLPGPVGILNPLAPLEKFDVFIVDQQSVCVPFLRALTGTPVVFYCHFPDKLLSGGWVIDSSSSPGNVSLSRQNAPLLKRLYRWPIDRLEEWTTGQSDVILSNSQFTSQVYASAFKTLAKRTPKVVYPAIDVAAYQKAAPESVDGVELVTDERLTLVSFNRFEAKKNVALAIESFAKVKKEGLVTKSIARDLRLVVGGGYDDALADNRETLVKLQKLCDTLGLSHYTLTSQTSSPAPKGVDVLFVLNFSTAQRSALLLAESTLALLYTPAHEHFGIVPIEAMACGLPVLAANSGGPTETVVDFASKDEPPTGFLREPTAEEWAPALADLVILSSADRAKVSENGKKRVQDHFSSESLGRDLHSACMQAIRFDPHTLIGDKLIAYGVTLVLAALIGLYIAVKWGGVEMPDLTPPAEE